MRRALRILGVVAASVAGLVIVLVVAALIAIQTPWFQNYARGKLVSEVDNATGGRAEVGRVSLSISQLRAQVDDFVLHGTEGPNEPPLVRVRSLAVALRIVSILHHKVAIDSVTITQPQVYVREARDGTTNIPHPKNPSPPSNKSPVRTVLDLAIRRFRLDHGLLQFADRKVPLNVRGENFRTHLDYHPGPSYTGNLSISPVYVERASRPRLPVSVNVPLKIAGNGIDISNARFETPHSLLVLTVSAPDVSAPRGTVRLNGRLSAEELASSFTSSTPPEARRAPPLDVNAAAALDRNTLRLDGAQLVLGASRFDASGLITDLKAVDGSIHFNGTLDLTELGRILALSARPQGTVNMGGEAKLAGSGNYNVTGRIDASNVAFQAGQTPVRNVKAGTDFSLTPREIALNGLHVNALGGTLAGRASLLQQSKKFNVDATLNNFDLHQLARNYAQRNLAWDGILSGPVHASGSAQAPIGRRLVANTRLAIRPGPQGIPLAGQIDANYNGPRDLVSLGNSYLQLPHSRLDLSGTIGTQLRIRLVSSDLDDFLPAIAMASANPPKTLPIALAKGQASFDGTVTGSLSDPVIAGHAGLANFLVEHHPFQKFAADLKAAKNGASVRNAVLTQGPMQASLNASIGLDNWKTSPNAPVSANAALRNANLQNLLALGGQQGAPVNGTLNVTAQVNGTMGDPSGTADVTLGKGILYGEPFDSMHARVNYSGQLVQLNADESGLGKGRLDLNASFQHPPKQFNAGRVQVHLASTPIQLQNVRTLVEREPGLNGTVQVQVDGAGDLQSAPGQPLFAPTGVNAVFSAKGLALQSKRLGDLVATAQTRGQNLDFHLQSDLAQSDIRGDGTAVLSGDYPVNAKLSLGSIRIATIRSLLSKPEQQPSNVDGEMQAVITVSGPALRWQDLKGALEMPVARLTATPRAEAGQHPGPQFVLHNPAPIRITLERGVVRLQDVRLVGSGTDFGATGTVNLTSQNALDVHVKGDIGLAIIPALDPSILSSGDVLLDAAVSGRTTQPLVNGRIELKNAAVNSLSSPNGLSNANGVILFNGAQALIQNLTGESGGGKLAVNGMLRYGNVPAMEFRVQGKADRVRIRSGSVSTKMNANVELAGTTKNSLVSGNVSILEVALHSHSDIGSMLSQTGAPATAPAVKPGPLGNMRLDVRVDTAPNVQFQTGLTQNLEAIAHLRLRGTPDRPGMLGRVNVTQGEIVFFGGKYTINRATVNFFDPTRILPVLDVNLGTKAKGVDVSLMVTGPIDKMRLTYSSDPPMPFSDIVQLLAVGKVPTTDPVLAAQQPPAPQQNLEQMGASAVLSQAVAAPVTGRLQRLFGVTKLKIDPQIIGPENTPQARVTLEQQISKDLDFTYITDVNRGNPQVVRIEWAVDPTWSAVALRQDNGEFGVDLYYKKRFR